MVAATFGTTAWADGTHGATFTVKNESGGKILVWTYNGNDTACVVAHKSYLIYNGGERTAKCHGNGTGRCHFKVFAGSSEFDGHEITNTFTCDKLIDNAKKGETCTITGRKAGDYNCQ